jgi:hypothetical protein
MSADPEWRIQDEKPANILDKSQRLVLTRSPRVDWMVSCQDRQETLAGLIESLVGEEMRKPFIQKLCVGESRGPHFKCIIGYQRQYAEVCLLFTCLSEANFS